MMTLTLRRLEPKFVSGEVGSERRERDQDRDRDRDRDLNLKYIITILQSPKTTCARSR